ncbi:MAG: hypothetical protein K0B11_14670 [Mariniphaga sp.]|nr:hypothetical protein [Mariniphaga sp.]
MGKIASTKNTIVLILLIIVTSLLIIDFLCVLRLKSSNREVATLRYELDLLSERRSFKDSIASRQIELRYLFEKGINKNACDTLLLHESKIFLLFGGNTCSQCVIKNIMDLNLISDRIGKDKIIIAGDFADRRTFENYLSKMPHSGFEHILFQDIINLSGIEIKVPIILLLDTNYTIKLLFFDYEENNFEKDLLFNRLINI